LTNREKPTLPNQKLANNFKTTTTTTSTTSTTKYKMSHWNGRKYYVQVAILTLPSKWKNISGISMDFIEQWKAEEKNSSDLVKSLTIWRCGVMFNNAARIIQKNWREYYLLNKIKPYTHRSKLDNCPLTRNKILSDMYKDKTKEYDSDYSTESNIEAAKEAAKLYDFELYEDEFREMREEELEELERLQEKMDGWVDEMCNPYNN
jgi:hypothetical protein